METLAIQPMETTSDPFPYENEAKQLRGLEEMVAIIHNDVSDFNMCDLGEKKGYQSKGKPPQNPYGNVPKQG